LEQTFLAAVRDVPIFTFEFLLFTFFPARHRFFLESPFHGEKAASKLLNDPFYAI
jgi:hypothetical protein